MVTFVQTSWQIRTVANDGERGGSPQYDTTHVYVLDNDIDAYVSSSVATFGGFASPRAGFTATPTPSKTASQYIRTPVGMLSVFAFQMPIRYPFGWA